MERARDFSTEKYEAHSMTVGKEREEAKYLLARQLMV